MDWHWRQLKGAIIATSINTRSILKNVFCGIIFIFLFSSISIRGIEAVQFKKGQLKINNQKILVEIASSEKQLKTGLMNRSKLDKESGMFFIYDQEQYLSFWMKNTNVPLSIAFINKEKIIVDIQDMEPLVGPVLDSNIKRYISNKPSMYALEMNKGWFKANNIRAGDRIKILFAIP